MSEIEDIQAAIERLSSRERADIARWLRHDWGENGDGVAEAAPKYEAERKLHRMSVEEYLEFEKNAPVRHEYVGGAVFAMSGASLRHVAITRNIVNAFTSHLRGNPCQAFMTDAKVRLQFNRDEIFYYPDVVVACGKLEMAKDHLREPKLIVEVLSPSTETIDRREKALHYRQIATLEEYVLVAQTKRAVTIYRRAEDWQPRVSEPAETGVEFRSIGLTLPLAEIYEATS